MMRFFVHCLGRIARAKSVNSLTLVSFLSLKKYSLLNLFPIFVDANDCENKLAKKRLDAILVERAITTTLDHAMKIILAGEVRVEDSIITHPGTYVTEKAAISLQPKDKFVSRGGIKLEGALEHFGLDVHQLVTADIGSSTGGFTDCLLQNGAQRVYSIDVGYGQIAYRLRTDPKVIMLERTNARHNLPIPEKIDLVTIDVSFISLTLVLPNLLKHLQTNGHIVALIKPQFEAKRNAVGKGGIVRVPQTHANVIGKIAIWGIRNGLRVRNINQSVLEGQKGNKEFFILLEKPY